MRAATWPVAAGSLLLGFAVAQATGVRPLGGIVLLLGAALVRGALAAQRGARRRTAALLVVYVGIASSGSHLIADAVGAWPAVLIAAGSPASPPGRWPTRR